MPQIKIYNGSSWLEPNAKVRGSSSWLDPEMKYWNGTSWQTLEGSPPAPVIDALANGSTNSRLDDPCYAGAAWYTSGTEYEYNSGGGLTSARTYITSGNAADVWVMWTRTGGTLSDWDSLGAGNNNVRLNITSTRAYRLVDSISSGAGGAETITGYFRFYDAASGGNLLDTTSTATWSARRWHDACPLCCFTPDTPVTMASGIEMPIGKVSEGDEILVWNPFTESHDVEPVTGVIIKKDRAMYRVKFSDGRHFDVSDDHPIHVKGKGAASINPVGEYKKLGTPERIQIGDRVATEDGRTVTIESWDRIHFPGPVFTFENSMFYANGVCVY